MPKSWTRRSSRIRRPPSIAPVDQIELFVTLWRAANSLMAVTGLVLLVSDMLRRRKLHLRARFYWEAVALLLVSTGWASIEAALHPPADWNPARTAVASVALVYFLISIVRVRRFNLREEQELSHGGRAM